MNPLPYHAVIEHSRRGGGATIILGRRSVVLDHEQFSFFKTYRWFALTESRIALLPSGIYDWFLKTGLIADSSSQNPGSVPPAEVISAALQTWRPLLACHELYRLLSNNRIAALIYLLERAKLTYHAPRILELAAHATTDPILKATLADYAGSEQDHYFALAQDLGLAPDALIGHEPTEGMTALLMALEALAVQRPLSLLVATALFEGDATDSPDNFDIKDLAAISDLPLSAFIEHSKIDLDADHGSVWKTFFAKSKDSLSYREIDAIIRDLHSIKHLIDLWNSSIVETAKRLNPLFEKLNVLPKITAALLIQREPGYTDFAG